MGCRRPRRREGVWWVAGGHGGPCQYTWQAPLCAHWHFASAVLSAEQLTFACSTLLRPSGGTCAGVAWRGVNMCRQSKPGLVAITLSFPLPPHTLSFPLPLRTLSFPLPPRTLSFPLPPRTQTLSSFTNLYSSRRRIRATMACAFANALVSCGGRQAGAENGEGGLLRLGAWLTRGGGDGSACTQRLCALRGMRACRMGFRNMAHGARRMAHGAWRMASGAWRTAHGARRMAHGERRMASGAWRAAHG
eukprot:354247-Chlamydomonas_euryale.AAC.1